MAWHGTKKASKLPEMDKSSIIVFDTETTGLDPVVDDILQVTILDGYGCTLFDSYIKPAVLRSWPLAQKVNHISYDMVKDAPTFASVRSEIQNIFNKARLIVGYNINFDINFLEAKGIVFSGQKFDVMTAFASYHADVDKTISRYCKLKECAEYFGIYYDPHSSSSDARATLSCFNALINDRRFTTYKAKEKKELKRENINREKPHTSITIGHKTGRRSPLLLGVLILIVGEVLYYLKQGVFVADINMLLQTVKQIPAMLQNSFVDCIPAILLAFGCLLIVIGLIRLLIRLPLWIVAKVKHLISILTD